MSGKAAKIMFTEGQHAILRQIIRSTTAPQRLVQRARLIVLAFGGMFNGAIECRESRAVLRRAIEDVLGDAPRSGSSGKFTAEQVTQVLAVACEPAEQSGRPIDEWTGRELADELVQRGIVSSISTSQVNRYLAEAELQPHGNKYWLNTTEFLLRKACWLATTQPKMSESNSRGRLMGVRSRCFRFASR